LSKTSTGGVHQMAVSVFGLLRRANGGAKLPSARHASEPPGHSRVGITLDLYSHGLPRLQDEVRRALTT
jgi:hypothetical protein